MNSAASAQWYSRRTSPTGSARTVFTGPTVRRPRRSVGRATDGSTRSPGPMPGTAMGTMRSPTGRSTTVPKERREVGFVTTSRACASSPTATRTGGGTSWKCSRILPTRYATATIVSATPTAPARTSSVQPQRYPAPSDRGATAMTTQPRGVTTEEATRPARDATRPTARPARTTVTRASADQPVRSPTSRVRAVVTVDPPEEPVTSRVTVDRGDDPSVTRRPGRSAGRSPRRPER